jgi:hypothetical protein
MGIGIMANDHPFSPQVLSIYDFYIRQWRKLLSTGVE